MKDWKQKAIELRTAGMSSRAIGRAVGRGKSTINDFFQTLSINEVPKRQVQPKAKILLLDVETAPLLGFMWGTFKQNIGLNQLEAHGYMLTWAAKWLGEEQSMSAALCDYEGYVPGSEDDSKLVADLLVLINQADIIIAHNLKGFDEKIINTRILMNGLDMPKPYRIIDTLEIARRHFRFTSNKLDGIAMQLGLSRKMQTGGFELWRGCMTGNVESWGHMLEYNIQDVFLLEEVYLKLRAWDSRHPNVALYDDLKEPTCVCCGSTDLTSVDGAFAYTGVSIFGVLKCGGCGKHNRTRKNVNQKEKAPNILSNIAG